MDCRRFRGDIFDIKDARPNQLHEYDIIILGSALYAGSIKGLYLLVDNYEKIMMGMVRKMVLKNGADKVNGENKEFLETYGKTVDFTDRDSIK